MVLGAGLLVFGFKVADGAKHIFGGARSQNVAVVPGHAGKDLSNLRWSLAGGKYDFGHAGAEGAVMIELGKTDVFERQVAQPVEGIVDGGAALTDFVEQRFDLRAIHQGSFAAPLAA
jgi:hypothetical protein